MAICKARSISGHPLPNFVNYERIIKIIKEIVLKRQLFTKVNEKKNR